MKRIPASIRRAIFRRGRLRVITGESVANAKGQHFAGLTNYRNATVAADHQDAEQTFLHELAHMLDNAKGWQSISNSEAWLSLWRAEKAAGRVSSFAGQDQEASESFAEGSARHFSGDTTLPAAVHTFMADLEGSTC